MQRVKRSTAISVKPAPPNGGTPGYFANPNPQGGVPATVPGYEWYNNVQEEIVAVVQAAGLALSDNDQTQLVQAIIKKGFQGSYFKIATGGGTADAITATFTPGIAELSNGMTLYVRAASANTTTAPTFTPASGTIAAKNIVKGAGATLSAGDIAGVGHWIELKYDATLDKWVLINPATGVSSSISGSVFQTQTYTAFNSGGVAPAFTITPTPDIGSYAAKQRFRVAFNTPGTTGSNTLNVSGLGARNIKQYDNNGNKVSGIVASGQLADIEYDGTDFVILNPLPPAVSSPSPVRQTVLSGPVDTNGLPSFLPATSASLSITSQNISSGYAALVVSAANGFTAGGASDRIGYSTSNLTWSGLSANATNYLYVDVSQNGTLTTGSTTFPPTYQQGGARYISTGQATFNTSEMYMSVGNGAAALQVYRVFVGYCVTSASAVTSAAAYAYMAAYISPWVSTLPSGGSLLVINHNIGTDLVSTDLEVENITADFNYTPGVRIKNPMQQSTYWVTAMWRQSRHTTTCRGGVNSFCSAPDAASGAMSTLTPSSWKYRVLVKRDW